MPTEQPHRDGAEAVENVANNPRVLAAIEKADEIMRRPGARAALDRLCCRVYDAVQDAAIEDSDLSELVKEVGEVDAIVMTLGWMLGHPGASAPDREHRQRVTQRAALLAAAVAGCSVELNHFALQKAVN